MGPGVQNKPGVPFAPEIRVAAADAHGIVDTGTTNHVSGEFSLLTNVRPLQKNILLNLALFDGSVMATHVGTISLPWKHSTIQLENVLYCPMVQGTLILLGQLIDDGFEVSLENGAIVVWERLSGGMVMAQFSNWSWRVSLQSISCPPLSSLAPSIMQLAGDWHPLLQWHSWLGHAYDKVIKTYLRQFVPSFGIRTWNPFFCETCAAAKSERWQAALQSKVPSNKKCDLVVSDILGPVDPADMFGNQYILTLQYHATTFLYYFLLKSRLELETKLTNALKIIKTQVGAPNFFAVTTPRSIPRDCLWPSSTHWAPLKP
jgi:hypothetical protein